MMDRETEIKVVKFIRTVVTSGIDPNMCNDALDLLLELYTEMRKIGNFKVSPTQYKEIVDAIQDDKKIMAIKLVRKYVNCGLKEAKDAVDYFMEYNKADYYVPPVKEEEDIPF